MRKLAALTFLIALTLARPTPAGAEEILVSAAASLTDVLKNIASIYEIHTKSTVRFNFASSSALARQIDEGAPADIFFSADQEKMDGLEKKGRIDSATRKNLLSNRLVIVVPVDSTAKIHSPKDLLGVEVTRVAIAQPASVPVGIYAKEYLKSQKMWDGIAPKVSPVLDVRAALAAVESGNVDAGFVYKTDAAISKRVKVVYEVPKDQGPKITYPVAIVKDSTKKQAASDFLQFVFSKAARAIFEKYGFVVLP